MGKITGEPGSYQEDRKPVDDLHVRDHHPSVATEQGNATMEAALQAAKIDYDALLKYQISAIGGISRANSAVLPGMTNAAISSANSFANQLNPQIANEFYSYLSNLNPTWQADAVGVQKNALYQVSNFAQGLMNGDELKNNLNTIGDAMAAMGYEKGQWGGLATNNLARNIGLTDLQLKQQGAQLFTEAVSPLSARLLSTTQSLMPPTINRGAMASQILSGLSAGIGSSQTAQAGVINAAQTNADLAWSSRLSAFNASNDYYTNAANVAMQNRAVSIAQQNNNMQTMSGIAGMGVGAATMYFSDRRLKRNIVPAGSSVCGIPQYAFQYLWSNEVHVGVMSDDVRKVKPEAVSVIGGFDVVDYSLL